MQIVENSDQSSLFCKSMDSLIEIPHSGWSKLRDLYRKSYPDGAIASCILDTHFKCPALAEAINFKVYCPSGDMSNGMIAVVDNNNMELLEVMIHPIGKDTKAIETALLSTDKIDWNRNIMVPPASLDVIHCLNRTKKHLGLKVIYNDDTKAFKHLLNRNTKEFDNLICPPDTYVGPLKPEHLDLIDKTWIYHSNTSHYFFETLMQNGLIYVLYSNDHEPVAWGTINPEGALTHLYCVEAHRRKGYGEYITKVIVNDLIRRDSDILAYTLMDNVTAHALFAKLGFEIIGHDYWAFINKEI